MLTLGGGMKSGSGRGRRFVLDDLPSMSPTSSAPPFWSIKKRNRHVVTNGTINSIFMETLVKHVFHFLRWKKKVEK